jgi:hypothetical protein
LSIAQLSEQVEDKKKERHREPCPEHTQAGSATNVPVNQFDYH